MFFDRAVMGLRPTQGDEKRLLFSNRSLWKRRPPLCHPERTRISYYAAPKMTSFAAFIKESRMSFAERGICSSADLYWKCFSTERFHS
jgi:hypothetical protein